MINKELPPPPTLSENEILLRVERLYFKYLRRTRPEKTLIAYEKVALIEDRPKHKKRKKTVPDFYVLEPNNHQDFVEITTSKRREGKKDPKRKQKAIARNAGAELTVVYEEDLRAIQEEYPDLVFFNNKKVRDSGVIFDSKNPLPTYNSISGNC
jgi:hypothetical protein